MSAGTIFMVRVEVVGVVNSSWDLWFSDRAEMDGFLQRRQPQLVVTDIHERDTNTAERALDAMDEHIAEMAATACVHCGMPETEHEQGGCCGDGGGSTFKQEAA